MKDACPYFKQGRCKYGQSCKYTHKLTVNLLDPPTSIFSYVPELDLHVISTDEIRYSLKYNNLTRVLDNMWIDNYTKMYKYLNNLCKTNNELYSPSNRLVDLRINPACFNLPFDLKFVEQQIVKLQESDPVFTDCKLLTSFNDEIEILDVENAPGFVKEYAFMKDVENYEGEIPNGGYEKSKEEWTKDNSDKGFADRTKSFAERNYAGGNTNFVNRNFADSNKSFADRNSFEDSKKYSDRNFTDRNLDGQKNYMNKNYDGNKNYNTNRSYQNKNYSNINNYQNKNYTDMNYKSSSTPYRNTNYDNTNRRNSNFRNNNSYNKDNFNSRDNFTRNDFNRSNFNSRDTSNYRENNFNNRDTSSRDSYNNRDTTNYRNHSSRDSTNYRNNYSRNDSNYSDSTRNKNIYQSPSTTRSYDKQNFSPRTSINNDLPYDNKSRQNTSNKTDTEDGETFEHKNVPYEYSKE